MFYYKYVHYSTFCLSEQKRGATRRAKYLFHMKREAENTCFPPTPSQFCLAYTRPLVPSRARWSPIRGRRSSAC